jgi:hypothetical protein
MNLLADQDIVSKIKNPKGSLNIERYLKLLFQYNMLGSFVDQELQPLVLQEFINLASSLDEKEFSCGFAWLKCEAALQNSKNRGNLVARLLPNKLIRWIDTDIVRVKRFSMMILRICLERYGSEYKFLHEFLNDSCGCKVLFSTLSVAVESQDPEIFAEASKILSRVAGMDEFANQFFKDTPGFFPLILLHLTERDAKAKLKLNKFNSTVVTAAIQYNDDDQLITSTAYNGARAFTTVGVKKGVKVWKFQVEKDERYNGNK